MVMHLAPPPPRDNSDPSIVIRQRLPGLNWLLPARMSLALITSKPDWLSSSIVYTFSLVTNYMPWSKSEKISPAVPLFPLLHHRVNPPSAIHDFHLEP
jgi:hypothetical protein